MANQNQNVSSSGSQGNVRGGVDNVLYDVITVLHEKSKGLEAYQQYEEDFQGNSR
jgi:hypothetical protein